MTASLDLVPDLRPLVLLILIALGTCTAEESERAFDLADVEVDR